MEKAAAASVALAVFVLGLLVDSGAVGVVETKPLTVVASPTPRLPVPRYDTSGTYLQVRDGDLDLSAVNATLREAVLTDQRAFAPAARRASVGTARSYRGIYETSVDRGLLSASAKVVSELMPATERYPGGSLGKGWIAVTVRVPSGARVAISGLFRDPAEALPVLGAAWIAALPNQARAFCVMLHLGDYEPTARHYRYFALTPKGLALGFWQEAACNRLQAIVPYSILKPYLSKLGAMLIAGVRRAR
jgi:hypothetical protein